MFGRNPRLPIDLIFGEINTDNGREYSKFVQDWKYIMQEAYEKANKLSIDSAARGKRVHDQHIRSSLLHAGDRVLIRRMVDNKGQGKMKSYWEDDIWYINRKIGEGSVYEVRHPKTGQLRILHRNMLLQCNSLPVAEIEGTKRLKKSSGTLKRGVSNEKAINPSDTEGEELDPWEIEDELEAPSVAGDNIAGAWGLPKRKRVPPDRFGAPVVHYHYITSQVFEC